MELYYLFLTAFLFSVASLCLLYIGYPLFLLCFPRARMKNSTKRKAQNYPSVSLLICTYNEEPVIEQKIKNSLELDYPEEKMEIVFVDSGSTDRTRGIIQNHVDGNRMKLLTQLERLGQNSAENFAVPQLSGELVMTTDAEAILAKDAVKEAVKNFADSDVGAVTGKICLITSGTLSEGIESAYKGFQVFLNDLESRVDSAFTMQGELLIFRRELFRQINPARGGDDHSTAFSIRKQGYRVLHDSGAKFYERAPESLVERTEQKIRRGALIIESILEFKDMILNPKYGKFGVIILPAHIGMLMVSPWIVLLMGFSTLWLLITMNLPFYIYLLLISAGVLISTIRKVSLVIISFLHSQLAMIVALKRVIFKDKNVLWKKTSSTRRLISLGKT